MTRLLDALLSAILFPLALLVYVLWWRPHERQVLLAAAKPYRCDGDLVAWEINGHKVEMFRWLE